MPESLTLTFAELGFVLALRTPRSAALRGDLSLQDERITPPVARAGLASLLARGLCQAEKSGESVPGQGGEGTASGVRFDGELAVLLRILADPDCVTTVAGAWRGEVGSVVHLVEGDGARMVLAPSRFGCFTAETLSAAEPLSTLLRAFLAGHLAEASTSALVVRAVRGERSVSLAIAVDGQGRWFVSDSVRDPVRSMPATPESAVARMTELMDGLTGGGAVAARADAAAVAQGGRR